MTGLADEVEVTRLPVRVLEAEATLAEIDLARNASVHHPLQRAVDGGTTDPLILAAYQVDKIVGAEMPFLPQEDVDNLFPLTGPLPARWFKPGQVLKGGRHVRSRVRRQDCDPWEPRR